jgi:hypothetical protein
VVCIVTLAALVGSTRAGWAQCKPAVVAQGDPVLVSGLTTRLAANGISTSSSDGCPTLHVSIEKHGTQLHVRLADASQRTGEREVQDIATAAAIVESWTYQEIEAGMLPEVRSEPIPVVLPPRSTTRSGLSASFVTGLGSNGATTWVGGSLSACKRIGSLCAGTTLRSQLDTKATGETMMLAQSSYALGALATLDLPRQIGSLIISPGIGVGYAYLHVTTMHQDAMHNTVDVGTADHQLRCGAHAAVLKSLSDHLAAVVDVSADTAVLRSESQSGPAAHVSLAIGLRLEER